MEETKNDRFRLLLMQRGGYKTTLYDISHTIQSVLPDLDTNSPWPYCLGTDCRVVIIHETEKIAAKILSEIANHFLSNTLLMALFPECIPDPKRNTINAVQLELPRKSFWKEKTIEAMGMGAKAQGVHYNILKPDDIIGVEARESKILMQFAKDWVDGIQAFLTGFKEPDRIDFSGTRYGHDDVYDHIMKTYGEELKVLRIPAEENVKVFDEENKPVIDKETGKQKEVRIPTFPEEYPAERLKILKKNRKIYSSWYLNDPDSDQTDFDLSKLRYWYWRQARQSIITFNNDDKHPTTYSLNELDKLILIDPATTGITVTGTDVRMQIFLLQAIKDSFTTPEFIKLIFSLYLQWMPRAVVFEEVLFSSLYEYIFIQEMLKRGFKFKIIMNKVLGGKNNDNSKFVRIKPLANYLEDKQLIINESQEDVKDEMRKFGTSTDVHLLDSLSMGMKHWKPFDFKNSQSNTSYSNNNSRVRDAVSGYTPM
jgi:hypothetical protein